MKFIPPIDFTGYDAIKWSESHPDAAANALTLVAGYLRSGEAVPSELAKYLADAIEVSMVKPIKLRARAFTDELHLTVSHRPPSGYWLAIGNDADMLISEGKTQYDAFSEIAGKYKNDFEIEISEETVRNYWRKYKEALEEDQRISDGER